MIANVYYAVTEEHLVTANGVYVLSLPVACPEGTFYQMKILKCIPCPQGSYQDDEGRLFCKRCGEGKTTRGLGSREKDDCVINRGNKTLCILLLV